MISIITSRTLAPPQRTIYFRTVKSGPNAAILQFSEIREFLRKKQILHLMFHFISITGGQRPEFLINTKQISPALTENCIATKSDKFPRRVFVAEGLSKNF